MKKYILTLVVSVLVLILGSGVFLFFKGFFESSLTTLEQEILAAVLGTIMISAVTVLLLRAQSAAEEAKQKSLGIFQHKLELYTKFIDVLLLNIEDGRLDQKEVEELRAWAIRISLIAGEVAAGTLSDFVAQCTRFGKFRWTDYTPEQVEQWRVWYKEIYEEDPGDEDLDFLSVGLVVGVLRADLGEAQVSNDPSSALAMVDSLVDGMNRRRSRCRKA